MFFAIIVLFRLYKERGDLFLSTERVAKKGKAVAVDIGVMIAGLATFFVWNLPILTSAASRENYINWLAIQAESNQNSQRGNVSYTGIQEWWPMIEVYFGNNALLPWILLSGLVACVAALFIKKSKDVSFHALLALVWVGVPATYVILTVKKVWLWYLLLPGLFLLLGPVLLFVVGDRLRGIGHRLWGGSLSAIATLLLILQIYVAVPDYAALASQRWQETKRADFVDVEAMRTSLTHEIAGHLDETSMIVDPQLTLPVEEWRAAGANVDVRHLPNISEKLITTQKPTYLVIRLWGYAHHRGDRKKALSDFEAKIEASCTRGGPCYDEWARYDPSRTIVYRKRNINSDAN